MHDRTGTWRDYLGLPPTPDVQPHDQRLVKLLEELKKIKYWAGRCRAVYEAIVGKRTWDHFHIFKNISDGRWDSEYKKFKFKYFARASVIKTQSNKKYEDYFF